MPTHREDVAPSLRAAVAGLSLTMLLAAMATSIANVALPALTQVFTAPFQAVQWVVLAYLLAVTSVIVGAGRLGDILGQRRLLLAGLGLFILASAACAAASSLPLLIAARAVQGLGAAAMLSMTIALVGATVPKERTGRTMGMLGTMSAIGTALGPSLGGSLIAGFGWRALFLVNIPLGIAAFWLAWRSLPSAPARSKAERPGFDWLGTLVLALTLAAYALAMSLARQDVSPATIGLLILTAAGTGLFIMVQAKVSTPLIRLALLRRPGLVAGLSTSAVVATVMMATLVVGPFYLTRALGLEVALVGFATAIGPGVAALSGIPAGRLVERFGSSATSLVGLATMVCGCILLSQIPERLGLPGYVVPIALVTAGYALFQTANNTAVMHDVDTEQRGLVSGLLNLSRNLGLITGASAMGAIFALATANGDVVTAPALAVAAGTRFTFAVAAGLTSIALAVIVATRPR